MTGGVWVTCYHPNSRLFSPSIGIKAGVLDEGREGECQFSYKRVCMVCIVFYSGENII